MIVRIVLIGAAVIAVQAVLWGIALLWIRRGLKSLGKQTADYCRASGRKILRGPASANFRGATSVFGTVRGNGVICLTDRDLLFRKLFGGSIDIPLRNIGGVSVKDSFMGKTSAGTGGRILVVQTRDGNEIGFLVSDGAAWEEDILRAGG